MAFTLPTAGTDPKVATKGDLETNINSELDKKANIITGYSDDYDVILTGADGFGGAAFGENKADLGPLSIEMTDAGRFMVMGADKFIIGELAYLSDTDADPEAALSAAAVVPYVGENIYAVEGEVFDLFAAGMLADRGNVDSVRFSLQSGQGYSVAGTEVLRVDADSLGDTAYIQARRINDTGGTFPEIIMDCYTATKSPVSGASPTIISIGDSITYRSGTAWAGWYLEEWGYTPSFVGTLLSLEETLDGDTAARQGDEGRPGHTLQDMTYDVTTRVSPVASGDEATYLALDTTNRRLKNPFLRLSTGSDDAEDIYNGYVVDFAFYVSRFGYAAPDILWHGYGTNDIRDVPYDELEDKIFELDSLIYRRWHLDYPTKPVVRFLPGTNWETDRNEVWNSGYIPAIRGMMRAAKAATGPVLLIPTWAMHTADGGYDLERVDAPDAVTGATMRTLEDLHPTGATRRGLFKAVAAGLACASTANYGA